MTNGWQEVPLKEVAKPISRSVPVEAGTEYRTIGVKWWGMGAYERETIDGSRTAAKTLSIVREGDLIINKIWVRHGSVAVANKDVDGCAGSGEFPTFELDLNLVEPRWIHWQIKMKSFWEKCDSLSRGTSGKNRIKPELFLTINIPLPTLEEQRRVLERVETLSAHIAKAQSLREKVSDETDAFLYSFLNSLFIKLPFPRRTIGELCATTSGGTPSRSRADFYQGEIPWIKSGELEDGFIHHAEEHITEEAITSSSTKIFPKGTLVVALYGATVGKTGVLEIDAATNQAVCALFPKDEIYRDYLWWFLRSKRPDFLKSSFGGAQPNISQKVVRETEIPVPPLDEQRRIVAYLDSVQVRLASLRELQSQTGEELDALLPSVLDRAFKGEL